MWSLLYLVARTLVRLLVIAGPAGRADGSKDLEILVLRHQLRVLQRTPGRPKLRVIDRILLAAASRVLPRERWVAFFVAPATLLRWHRELVAHEVDLPPDRSSRPATDRPGSPCAHPPARPGEPPLGARADRGRASPARPPGRGDDGPHPAPDALCPRVHRAREPADPPESRNGAPGLGLGYPAGAQPRHGPRRPRTCRPVPHPGPGREVQPVVQHGAPRGGDAGLIRTPIRAPNANAHAERVIATIRAECLDWTLILGRGHLDRTLRTYVEHYNRGRPHRALGLAPPRAEARDPIPVSPHDVRQRDLFGGLIHEYYGAAA